MKTIEASLQGIPGHELIHRRGSFTERHYEVPYLFSPSLEHGRRKGRYNTYGNPPQKTEECFSENTVCTLYTTPFPSGGYSPDYIGAPYH